MTSPYSYLRLAGMTCRWPPCPKLLESPSAVYCGDSHRVRGAQEAKRLSALLALLDTAAGPGSSLLAHVAPADREQHLREARRRITRHLAVLRPEGCATADPAASEDSDSPLGACKTIVQRWPRTEVACLLRLALRSPQVYFAPSADLPSGATSGG